MKCFLSSKPIFLFGVFLSFLLLSCDIQSGNETVRNVSVNMAGTYRKESGIPSRQSGATTTRLSITQSGNQLYGVDEHNRRWQGSVTRAEGTNFATFNLKGSTTAGGDVTMTGDVRIDGTNARIVGLWVEPGFTSNFSAEATVAPGPSPTPQPGPTPTPTPAPANGDSGGDTDAPSLVITPS